MKFAAHSGMIFDENGITIAICQKLETREADAIEFTNRYNLHKELVSVLETITVAMECFDESGFWPNDIVPIDLAKDVLKKVEECKTT